MPPSRHSSSSHSSSSSSRSHSSSSHSSSSSRSYSSSSSSRSYSSSSSRSYGSSSGRSSSSHYSASNHSSYGGFTSGPSRRSTSTHSSSSSSGSSNYGSSFVNAGRYTPAGKPDATSSLTRYRKNQPTGFNVSSSGMLPKEYHCRSHDYVYYNTAWFDSSSGKTYEKGYYDENGTHYDQIVFKNQNGEMSKLKCEYCETEIKTNWTEGQKPSCPNCGAPLKDVGMDEIVYESRNAFGNQRVKKPKSRRRRVIFGIIAALLIGAGIFGDEDSDDTPSYSYTQNSTVNGQSSYFVEEIGRSCDWLDEYESYYDEPTDCYFWYNDYTDIQVWQYWYEGISSDFGDYGWMEYDEFEQCWYIEVDDGDWIVLPDNYDTSYLWHIQEN